MWGVEQAGFNSYYEGLERNYVGGLLRRWQRSLHPSSCNPDSIGRGLSRHNSDGEEVPHPKRIESRSTPSAGDVTLPERPTSLTLRTHSHESRPGDSDHVPLMEPSPSSTGYRRRASPSSIPRLSWSTGSHYKSYSTLPVMVKVLNPTDPGSGSLPSVPEYQKTVKKIRNSSWSSDSVFESNPCSASISSDCSGLVIGLTPFQDPDKTLVTPGDGDNCASEVLPGLTEASKQMPGPLKDSAVFDTPISISINTIEPMLSVKPEVSKG